MVTQDSGRTSLAGSSFLLCLLWTTGLQGQVHTCPDHDPPEGHGIVSGQVVDAQSQVPLGFAQVRLRVLGVEEPLEGLSSISGTYQFCSVPAGTLTLTGQLGQLGGLVGPILLDPGQILAAQLELSEAALERESGTLTGTVVDAGTGDPMDGVTVLLPGLGQTAISNSKGAFTFPSLPPGILGLQANRLGYAEVSGEVEIDIGITVHTRVELSTEPIAMDPIQVTAVRRRIVLPGLEDFERRYHSGWGKFVLEEEIRTRSPRRLADVLELAGTTTMGKVGFEALFIRRTGCGPLVFIDDVLATHCPRGLEGGRGSEGCDSGKDAFDAVSLVHPMDVVGVEVYRGPSEIPGPYIGSNAKCGVVLIWTRRGFSSGGV